jgi:phosphoglycolate phosphatase
MIHAAIGSAQLIGSVQSVNQAFHQSFVSQLTLFCDFDGPIVDVSDRYYQTYQLGLSEMQALYQQQGTPLPIYSLSKEQFWQMKQERTPDIEIAMRSGLQGLQIEQFLERVKRIVNQPDLLNHDRIQPGVKWALGLLHSQGVKLVLVTLRQQAQAIQLLRDHGLEALFSGIWGASDEDAAYLNQSDHKTLLLQQAAQVFQGEAWMTGDTEADILAGQSLGIPTIALTCGIRSGSYLQKFQPTRIHADLLSAAHYLTYQNEQSELAQV